MEVFVICIVPVLLLYSYISQEKSYLWVHLLRVVGAAAEGLGALREGVGALASAGGRDEEEARGDAGAAHERADAR